MKEISKYFAKYHILLSMNEPCPECGHDKYNHHQSSNSDTLCDECDCTMYFGADGR